DARHRDSDDSAADVDRDARRGLVDDATGDGACALEEHIVGEENRRQEQQEERRPSHGVPPPARALYTLEDDRAHAPVASTPAGSRFPGRTPAGRRIPTPSPVPEATSFSVQRASSPPGSWAWSSAPERRCSPETSGRPG